MEPPLGSTAAAAWERKKVPNGSKLVAVVTDPVESAKEAGLRYVTDAKPGITRKRAGKGFRYIGPKLPRYLVLHASAQPIFVHRRGEIVL